jgi:hypothetical protein
MIDPFRRTVLALLVIFLLVSVAGHLFFFTSDPAHEAQESGCLIHNGILYGERLQPLAIQPAISVEDTQVCFYSLKLGVEISHPPTI